MIMVVFILLPIVPPIATLAIAGVVLLLLLVGCCCCCCVCCCKKKEQEEDSEDEEDMDLSKMELIEVPEHERLEPSVDEMDYSVEGYFEEEDVDGTVLGKG